MRKIEILGSPDAGKTASLQRLAEQLKVEGIPYELVLETRGKDIFPKEQRGTLAYNMKVGRITTERIRERMNASKARFFLVDKGFVDYLFFTDYYLQTGRCTKEEAEEAKKLFGNDLMPDVIIVLVCRPEVANQRCTDSAESRTVKIQKSIDALEVFFENWRETPKHWLDTSDMTIDEVVAFIRTCM